MNDTIKSDIGAIGGWNVALGILIFISGMLAAATPIFTFVSATIFVATMILVAGIFALVHAFQDKGAGRKILDIILGVLSILAAIVMFQNPAGATMTLAVWISIWMLVRGVAELVWAFRTPIGRTLSVLNGVVDLFLGIVLLRMDAAGALAALGFYIAITLIFWGVSLIVHGSAIRRLSHAI